ncbi:MAG: GSCFA domain-containing protein [Leptospiraceae bacterium]|nr:GSCFA domain-containing protein [Leptospiraceae bacterium]
MKLQIETPIPFPNFNISHQDEIFLIGSCFSENIGKKLKQLKVKVFQNPFGILFNPVSIANTLNHLSSNITFNENLLIEKDGLWFSLIHHGSVYGTSKAELIRKIEKINVDGREKIVKANKLFITFGSAHIYTYIQQNTVVANCHKLPNSDFKKSLLKITEIIELYKICIASIKAINPTIQFVFTVSPVKYLKDGVHENQLSKSTLLLAIEELCKIENVSYFPAYEIVTDELRDYRYYNDDLVHPNQIAVNYVWEKFTKCYFTDETKSLANELEVINSMENHRLLHPESDSSKSFLANLEKKKRELISKFPFLQ